MLPPKKMKHSQKTMFGVLRAQIGHKKIWACLNVNLWMGPAWFVLVSTLKNNL